MVTDLLCTFTLFPTSEEFPTTNFVVMRLGDHRVLLLINSFRLIILAYILSEKQKLYYINPLTQPVKLHKKTVCGGVYI